jgi:anhydro-N-acetylmuramic acid kinase
MRVIGMISGTSADAIEAVLCQIDGAPPRLEVKVLAASTMLTPRDLQQRIHDAATRERSDVESITLLDGEIGERFATAAMELIAEAGLSPADIDLIGSHGQTIWHAVRDDGSVASTLQIGSGSFVAERTGITTVSDLRSRDVAAGGQGAPIVAFVDWLMLRHPTRYRAVQNLGGIGNVAYQPPVSDDQTDPTAFDTGPANVLIDVIMTLLTDGAVSYDKDGERGARGQMDEAWIEILMDQPYYDRKPPKTTGRELYSPAMGAEILAKGRDRSLSDDDIVATVTAYSADSVTDQYRRFLPVQPDEVIAAGGGTRNPTLMSRLAQGLPTGTPLMTLEDVGYASHQKEAIAIAVLANETWHGRPGTLPAFTGVRHPVLMGTITPGRLKLER